MLLLEVYLCFATILCTYLLTYVFQAQGQHLQSIRETSTPDVGQNVQRKLLESLLQAAYSIPAATNPEWPDAELHTVAKSFFSFLMLCFFLSKGGCRGADCGACLARAHSRATKRNGNGDFRLAARVDASSSIHSASMLHLLLSEGKKRTGFHTQNTHWCLLRRLFLGYGNVVVFGAAGKRRRKVS